MWSFLFALILIWLATIGHVLSDDRTVITEDPELPVPYTFKCAEWGHRIRDGKPYPNVWCANPDCPSKVEDEIPLDDDGFPLFPDQVPTEEY